MIMITVLVLISCLSDKGFVMFTKRDVYRKLKRSAFWHRTYLNEKFSSAERSMDIIRIHTTGKYIQRKYEA